MAEVGLIAAASAALTMLPQVNTDPEGAHRMMHSLGPVAPLLRAVQVDHILGAWWFLGLILVSGASLGLVVKDQWKRCAVQWRETLGPASFRGAAFRREWVRPASQAGPSLVIRTSGKAGLLGLPVFHTGLLLVLLAGFLRMLLASDAVVDLHEGELLPPSSPAAYGAQWPGRMGRPFSLEAPLTLEKVSPAFYPDGTLKGVSAEVRLGSDPAPVPMAVNDPLRFGSRQLFLSQTFGPAAFLEVSDGARVQRSVLLLREERPGIYTHLALQLGLELRLRGGVQQNGRPGGDLDLRVVRGGALVFAGPIRPGAAADLPGAGTVTLVDLRNWVQFRGSRDPFLPLAYAGFILALAGVALLFLVVPVDTAVGVEPCPEGERVWAALRVRRFAPLYAERFDRLARDNGAPGDPQE